MGRGARRSAEIRRPLRLQGRAGLSGTQIRRPGLAAGREIHRPCGQHSSGTAPRPVPLVALRLLHLEADKRQQCGRNRKTRTRQTQDQNPQRTLARRAHRMGIPDGTLPRLLVAGDRSLRQHRQGDPLCGAGIEKLEAYPLEERLHMERICRDELSELYMLSKDKRAEKQIQQCIGPAPRMAGDGRPLRTPPPRHDGLHDARLLEDALSARADLQREGQRILREMHGAGPRQRRSGRDLQHQRPLLPVHGGIRAGRGLHRLGRNRLQAQRHKSGFRLHIRSAVVALRESGRLQNALEALRTSNSIRHDDRVEEAQNSLAEMQTLFEVGQLELENPGWPTA